MSKKAKVYARGKYLEAMNFIRTKGIVTRQMVVDFLMKHGKQEPAALATATVLLSPRQADSERGKLGNSLGNGSADGIHYYMLPLKKVEGEAKRFRFHPCTPAEIEARTKLEAKRELPNCRAKAKAAADKARARKLAKKLAAKSKKQAKNKAHKVVKGVKQDKAPAAPAPAQVPAPAEAVTA